MKGQGVSDLHLLRDKLGRGQKWVKGPGVEGLSECTEVLRLQRVRSGEPEEWGAIQTSESGPH